MRSLNGRMLLAGVFGLICSVFVSTAVHTAPGVQDASRNSGTVDWSNETYVNNASGSKACIAACQAQCSQNTQLATAVDLLPC